ncbi:MAG TPA: sigma-70 family RNA polymerase sigma factor [Xanthobacteraceae bacterium]|nr:sigma-70 family RNA polymerase sigma factor [Xanthobacteraceae bacterium]
MEYGHAISGTALSRPSSANAISDEVLVGRIANGDRDAMRLLFIRHNLCVFRFLLRIVGNDATAEDLLSDVFLDVWRNAGRFEARSQVKTWLLGIARLKALSALKRRSFDVLDDGVAESIEDPADDPELVLRTAERGALLQACLRQLSSAHRQVVDLIYYHEQSIDEVARIIGVPRNTVKTRIFYARKRIAELLAAHGVERASL